MTRRTETTDKRPKAKANRKSLTETNVRALPAKPRQHFVWDTGRDSPRGFGVLVNPSGIATYFVNYKFPGEPKLKYKKLGRVGEVTLEDARKAARKARELAKEGKDPKGGDPTKSDSFETAFRAYIQQEQVGRKKNASAEETQSIVLNRCAEWKLRAVVTLQYREIDRLLAAIRDGDPKRGTQPRPYAAARIFSHLRDFFKWCTRQQIIKESPMVNMPSPFAGSPRDRYYSDDELRAIWKAADQLSAVDGSFVKLILLLATRKEELAQARWTEFDDPETPTVFTVPTERVKMGAEAKRRKRPVYVVPLPPLAQRIMKGLPKRDARVFPNFNPDSSGLQAKMVKAGAPKDFRLHTFRHTIATHFQTQGRSEWERGLLLNHSSGGSVTGGYSHGYPTKLKRELLTEWADHIEGLVKPDGIAVLR
jgi:integrase